MPRTVLISSLLALLAACAPQQAPGDASEPPAVVMHGVRLRSYDGSTLAMTGQAEQATYQRNGDLTATRATLHMPGKDQEGEQPGDTIVRAKSMEGNLGTRRMVASGDVEMRTASGMVALTPRATYDGAQQSAWGTEGVRVKGPDYRLQADAFSLSFPDEQFTFEGSVHTVLGAARD
ncbi:LPS export ABC transporter periplasmic protein LptC [Archangium sp.]|uniref:LPS export ABC transporter periplasmic protein LptC n=1 Tax=Archangium sp. TaxID=1872627 RepID=UPI002D41DD31|nr:LPS export ABC transporter periplasmic protein LptC [Archangium sp.]HYO55134.1 LPS export ABC transporter periplasmic protein LptC [Archangium sp.]